MRLRHLSNIVLGTQFSLFNEGGGGQGHKLQEARIAGILLKPGEHN